jgi:hypothetical protein
MNLLAALVLLLHGELIELTGDVVGGTGIAVPVGVHLVEGTIGALVLLFFFIFFFFLVAAPALVCYVARLATDLTHDGIAVLAADLASSMATIDAVATVLMTPAAVAVATASMTPSMIATPTRTSMSTRCLVDRGAAPSVTAEKLHASVEGKDMST